MKQDNRRIDAFAVSDWVSKFGNWRPINHLSDTSTYLLIMNIYLAMIDMNPLGIASKADREAELSAFESWFLDRGKSGDTLPRLMWILRKIGSGVVENPRQKRVAEDIRLSQMLLTFLAITDQGDDDPSNGTVDFFLERYREMIVTGWHNCSRGDHKEILYRGFVAALTTHGCDELMMLGRQRGLSESKLKNAMRQISIDDEDDDDYAPPSRPDVAEGSIVPSARRGAMSVQRKGSATKGQRGSKNAQKGD